LSYIVSFIYEFIYFFNEMAIYLVLGYGVAGLLHVLFPDSFIRRQLGKGSFGSVLKSTLFGIPLPLCSCGVIPVATSLRRSGASKGSVASFLISTPQVGADSFMITYSLIGWVFALARIIASLITAFFAGMVINIFDKGKQEPVIDMNTQSVKGNNYRERFSGIIQYVQFELFGSIAKYLLIGLIIAGLIGVFMPDDFFETYLDNTFLSMLLMLVIGIPMYICAAASTPIAASLLMKGLSPGAALIFLLAGPATNAVNFTAVTKIIGKQSTAIYLSSIALISFALGYVLNFFSAYFGVDNIIMHHHHDVIPFWLKITGSIILLSMFIWYYVHLFTGKRAMKKEIKPTNDFTLLNVKGMTCMHCVSSVKKAVESVEGTSAVHVDLEGQQVQFSISDTDKITQVKQQIINAGYEV
jgi:uncharacterized protein